MSQPLAARVLAAFALCVCASALADVPPLEFTGKTVVVYKQLEVLPDPQGSLAIQDIAKPENATRFRPAKAFDDKVGESSVYWLRFRVVNREPGRKTLAIFPAAAWNEAILFSEIEGHRPRRSGLLVPIPERDVEVTRRAWGDTPYFAMRADLEAGATTTLYLRVSSDWRYGLDEQIVVEVSDLELVRADERRLTPILALIVGILIALALYHLMLLFGLRDAGYGFYVMHVAGIAAMGPAFYGLTAEHLWPQHPGWALDAIVVWKAAIIIGLAQFTRLTLETRKNHRWLDVLLLVVVANCVLVLAFAPFGSYRLNNVLISPAMVAVYVLALVTGCVALAKGNPLARYFVAANVFTFLGIALTIMGEVGYLPGVPLSDFAGPAGTILEAVLLSRMLSYRVNLMRAQIEEQRIAEERQRREQEEDKRAFLEEQKVELENKVAARTAELAAERERSEALLRNILPAAIAQELKTQGHSAPRRHEEVSILFSDFVGFTQAVATMPAQRMVEELNDIFQGFDEIVGRHGLEKIKTIGDAYMAAAGLPDAQDDHAARCVLAALEMQSWLDARNATASMKWALRIGVHSGPVVAGVVGKKKYAYDVWGDTVNIASRLESSGTPGRVNISAYTYDLVRRRFECEYRGKVDAKGKGQIDMYFVVAPTEVVSV